MKKIKTFLTRRVLFIIFGLIFMVLAIIVAIKLAIKDNKVYQISKVDYGWHVSFKETNINNISLADYTFSGVEKGDTIIAKKILRQTKEDKNIIYPILNIKPENCLIDIYLNGKKVVDNYNNKENDYISIKRNYTVELPNNYNGDELKIKFNVQQSDANSILKNIIIMSENDYFNYQIRSNLTNYIVSSIIIVLGLILIIAVICNPNRSNRLIRLLWIGLIFLLAGLAMYAKYNILELFIDRSRIIENVEFVGLYLCMPCIVMLSYYTFQEMDKKFLSIYNLVLLFMFALTVGLNNVGAISYRDTMSAITIIMYITGIVLLFLNFNIYKMIDRIEKMFIGGMTIFYCQSMVTILISKVLTSYNWNKYSQIFIMLLILEFSITVIVYYVHVVKEYMNNITEQRILSTLAYTDPLTSINNRTKYEEYLEELVFKKCENISIFSFDLNNLKKINDSNGHESGDEYIRKFAKTLKKVFETQGFIGRIGGDEFIVILEKKITDYNNYIEKMQTIFSQCIEKEKFEFEASFAYGYANNDIDESNEIEALISLSDKRMYECKKEQKMGRDV